LVFVITVGAVVIVALAFTNTFKVNDLIDQGLLPSCTLVDQLAWEKMDPDAKKYIYTEFHCCGFDAPDPTCPPNNPGEPPIPGCKEVLVFTLLLFVLTL
jgi:hypothetical protein